MNATKGCWTCKDRKVSCDRTVPICNRCSKSKRACGGYGVRLSWVKNNDQKKSLLDSTYQPIQPSVVRHRSGQWVNVSSTDVRLHILAKSANGGVEEKGFKRHQLALPNFTRAMTSASKEMAASERELIQYFENVVIGILPTLGREKTAVGRLLLRMALSERSKASRAVLLSLIAFASRHRGNDRAYAARAKNAAIDALISATGAEMDTDTGIEHIAAGLTLSLVEADLDCDWIGHLCGAKKVVPIVEQKEHELGSDAAVMLEWLYHFDTFTRFSFRHWRTYMIRSTSHELGFVAADHPCIIQNRIARAAFVQTMSTTSKYAHPVVRLLAEVFETRLDASDPHYHSTEYQQYLDDLKSRLSDADLVTQEDREDSNQSCCLEFTRLAGLIYLERVSRNFSGQSIKLNVWKKDALSLLTNLNIYPPSFAMFIVGCETHTDEERIVILDFFTRLEQALHLNSLLEARGLVQSAWIQHDLVVEGELEYIHKINLVMSSRGVIPSFM